MNKLILAAGMIGLALVTSQAEAGSHNNLKSKPPQTACDCSNCSAQHCQTPPSPSGGAQHFFTIEFKEGRT